MFFPDQHLGRNTAFALGWPLESMVVYDPQQPEGGLTPEQVRAARFILWKGHCSVHKRFTIDQVEKARKEHPGINILVHPECTQEVNDLADVSGSTGKIVKTVQEAAPGTKWAIGTELHLVNRLKNEQTDKQVFFLSPMVCRCATMFRIDAVHLCWSMENLVQGHVVNHISVPDDDKAPARVALDRMMALC
ncbi:MAG: quinolinate synthase NadA [Thaumarchaeota archaeon]|nr:quinolinate synthase NadA [Nitrososphaerota archaeon]